MTGELEAVADIATGALAARAIDDESAAGRDGHSHESHCLNCRTALIGSHCHQCGQHAHVHRTIGGFAHDILHGVFHFEGKIWGTLPLLVRRPGELTRRYAHGERAKFVSPTALFLFSVFLMFAIFGWVGGPVRLGIDDTPITAANGDMTAERIDLQAKLRRVDTQIAAARAAGRRVDALERSRSDLAEDLANLGMVHDTTSALDEGKLPDDWKASGLATGIPSLDKKIEHLEHNPELALYKLQSSAYKFSWLLIPISLPFIWLLFPFRRGVTMYDHAVFATYSLCFMTLLVVTLSILVAIGLPTGWSLALLAILPPIHMYRQIRGAYLASRIGALLRTVLLLVITTITSAFFFLSLVGIGVMG